MVVHSTIHRFACAVLLLGAIAGRSHGYRAGGDGKGGGAGPGAGTATGKGAVPSAPDFPISLPIGAAVPDPVTLLPGRPDVCVGRVTALARALQCPNCAGTGAKVTRHRDRAPARVVPTMRETRADCVDCHGTGFSVNPSRVSPVLDSLVLLLGGVDPDGPSTTKLLDKARTVLERLGASGNLVEKVTATTRNCVTSDRIPCRGTACSVTGEVGSPIPIGGGVRLIPVKVSAHSMVFLRAPIINAVPSGGAVLAGGVIAGPIEKIEWQWGQTMILDGGYLVPLVAPEHKGPGIDADKDGVIDGPSPPVNVPRGK